MKTTIKLICALLPLAAAFSCAGGRADSADAVQVAENRIVADEISNLKVSSFAEDSLGHIWIGTFRGLNKYDSYDYLQYFYTGEETDLPDNQINDVFCDSRGRLWVTTVNGVCRYNSSDNFKRIPLNTWNNNSYYFIEDKEGRIFLNQIFQLLVYNPETEAFDVAINRLDPHSTLNERCHVDEDNNLWVSDPRSLRCYDPATMEMRDSIPLAGYPVYYYLEKSGLMWLAGDGNISVFNVGSREFEQVPQCIAAHPQLSRARVQAIRPYEDGLLFSTYMQGLFYYNRKDGTVCREGESGFPFDAPGFYVTGMFTDSRGNLWMRSDDSGYAVCYNYKKRFNSDPHLQAAFRNKSVTCLTADKADRLWIATSMDGLWVSDPSDNSIVNVKLPPLPAKKGYGPRIDYIFIDRDGYIWLCVELEWVARCSYRGGVLSVEESFRLPWARYITQDKYGTIWISASASFMYYRHPGEKEFSRADVFPATFTFVPVLLPADDGSVLAAGFSNPLKSVDPRTGKAKDLPVSEEDYRACIPKSVLIPVDMLQDRNGDVWIASITNGIMRYSPSDSTMVPVPGTSCSDISSIEEDAHGHIWAGTLHGLCKYDSESGKFINWYASDGIGGNQFNERASCVLSDGTMVFGGTHGLTIFNPEEMEGKEEVPLVFESLKVYNERIVPGEDGCIDRDLSLKPDIRLKHTQNGFSISFAALSYSEFQSIRYSYRLEGFDNYWIDAGNNHEAYYANLPAGRYTFRVRISDNDKSVVETENSIRIIVKPSPWKSWWARLIYILVALGIVYFIYRLWQGIQREKEAVRFSEMEKEQEKRINKMNMSFFANVSHEFRTPLTMISGPVSQLCADPSISGNNKKLLQIVQRSSARMLRLVNQLLDFNKLEEDTLKLKVRRTDVIALLREYVEMYAVKAQEKGLFLMTYGLEDTFLMCVDQDKLDKIVANLMSNAIKFTPPGGQISVSFDVVSYGEAAAEFALSENDIDDRYVKLSVADTGPGIPPDKLEKVFERYFQLDGGTTGNYNYGSGIGLYYARRLAEIHHGYLKADNRGDSTGAVFTLILPAGDAAYSVAEYDTGVESQEKAYPLNEAAGRAAGGAAGASGGAAGVSGGVSGVSGGAAGVAGVAGVAAGVAGGAAGVSGGTDEADGGRPTILVVDDDADVVYYIKTLLSERYRVVCRFNAETAMEIIEQDIPDLVLCDVAMPGKNGYELCRDIKQNLQLCHIPVILITAKVSVQDQVQGLDSGADAYVTKPFEPSFLLAMINTQLKNRENLRSLFNSTTKIEEIEKSEENTLSPQDNAFMADLYKLMEEELMNSEMNVVGAAEQLHVSRTKFYYKVKALTGESPSNFFKTYKLNRAAELLKEGRNTVSEIADLTGFGTLSHFSTSFKKHFGVPPSEYGK